MASERADDAAAAITDSLGVPAMRWRSQLVEARRLTWHGNLSSAKRWARSALEAGQEAGEDAAFLHRGQLYLIWWAEGRLPEVGAALDSMPLDRPLERAFACYAYAHMSRAREAQGLLAGLAARAFADVPYDGSWLTVMALVADAAARVAEGDLVDEIHELLWPWRDQVVVSPTTCLGIVAHYLGMLAAGLGRPAEADAVFAQATEAHERMDAPIWTARSRLELGRSLLGRDPDRAGRLLALAHQAAVAHGARGIATEAAMLTRV